MSTSSLAQAPPVPATEMGVDRDWPAVIASSLGLIFSVGTLSVYTFGVFIGPLSSEFGWSRTQLSGAIAVSSYVQAASLPFWGLLTDRLGPRPIILFSVVMLSLLVASLSLLGPHLWQFYLVFAAIPLLAGGATPLGYSAVMIRRFDRKLGLALGLGLMGVSLGSAVLPPLSQALLGAYGWRTTYALLGLLALVLTVPTAIIATRNAAGPAFSREASRAAPIGQLVKTRAFLLVCATILLLGTICSGLLAHLVPMMIDRGFTPIAAASLAGVVGVAALVVRGGLGWVLDRIHAPYAIAAVGLLLSVSLLLLAFGSGVESTYLAAILLGTGLGAEVDFVSFLIRRYFSPATFGRLYGIAFALFTVGLGTGPLLLGRSFDHWDGYTPGLLLFAVLGVAVAGLSLWMPSYSRASQTAG